MNPNTKSEEFRNQIATVDSKGKRIWIYPKKPKGKWYNRRKILSYLLLFLLFAGPHLRIAGEPLLLLDVIERKFVIFGQVFWPQDMYLFALLLVTFIVFIILFTVVFGRLFCGWICPQTIFMEMVFRRIEYWLEGDASSQRQLNKAPWNAKKIRIKFAKHTLFWILSFLIANTFLAYFIGSEKLLTIVSDPPGSHIVGLISILVFTTIFYLVFAQMREQVCTTVCPYGRLQGVLLDQRSMIVAYDHVRGEGKTGRARFTKNANRASTGNGDCIDCNQCVNVCPTGIDIRNGTQLECVNCTACMDACDTIMRGVGFQENLIRYDSEEGIKNGTPFTWTNRIKAYTAVLGLLVILLVTMIAVRNDVQVNVLRTRGTTFQRIENQVIVNQYDLFMLNKTAEIIPLEFRLLEGAGEIEVIGKSINLKPRSEQQGRLMIRMPENQINGRSTAITIGIFNEQGELIHKEETNFLGPVL